MKLRLTALAALATIRPEAAEEPLERRGSGGLQSRGSRFDRWSPKPTARAAGMAVILLSAIWQLISVEAPAAQTTDFA